MMRGLLSKTLMFAVLAIHCRAENPPEGAVLTTVAEVRAIKDLSANNTRPLSLTGIVTLVDAARNMIVLQDPTGAVALHPDASNPSLQPGQRVTLSASACSPYVASLPGYPFQPAGRDIRPLFETPGNEGDFRLTRMRGLLQPPVTGNYTFWVASDDSSELWLSANADPAQAARIASVSGWTDRRDWSRFPTQRSETLFLRAGESYFIEALQEQKSEQSHLSVAWEGPALKQAIIEGRFIMPWPENTGEVAPDGSTSSPARGILREYWTDYSVGRVGLLKVANPGEVGLTVRGMQVVRLAEGVWPDPKPFDPSLPLAPDEICQWVEGEGAVGFLASDGTSATLELGVAGNRILLCVARWRGNLPPLSPQLCARFRGVREGVRDATDHLMTGQISVPSELEVTFFESPGKPSQGFTSTLRDPVAPGPGGYFFTRGVITFNDRVRDTDCIFIQDASNGMLISQAERQLGNQLHVGRALQIGGPLLPGKYSPGIRPATLNILGWQNLPAPVIPSSEAPAASYRDGLWTEIEGVARAVNADGTVLLMGRQVPLLVWIGKADRKSLESLVNSTLRVRGVMSLELFDNAALLVPSRSFVEVVEPAPELPAKPAPVTELRGYGSETGWPHQVKVAGAVTYRSERDFFLQDESGGVRVEPRDAPPSRMGESVQVVGFPGKEGSAPRLTEAIWQPLESGMQVVPVDLDPRDPDPARNGVLVTVEARLVSNKLRGADQILELETNQHVFEAVLGKAAGSLKSFANGSVLAVTGVCVLDTSTSSAALSGILMRTPLDTTLLHGPPWWTWQRTATAIGLLLVVLAASLIRIEYLKRRFARQQASRLAFARGMLESQESERRRIAASLHDSLGQNLLAIRSQAHLALQAVADPSGVRQRLEEISDTTVEAINEVREITHDLRPYQLDRLGLTQAIRALTRKVSESHPVSFACHVDDIDGIFDNDSEIHVYRIIQEGINNIIKHSGATEAAVVIKAASDNLSISIRDNGRGLADTALSDAGFGLSGIRERAEIMGGTARVDSSPAQGVNLQIQIPLQQPAK